MGTTKLGPGKTGVSRLVASAVFLPLVAAVVFPLAAGAGSSEMESGQGYVDQVVVERSSGSIALLGWAAAVRRGEQTVSVAVRLDDNVIYKGAFERYERPDVVKATGRRELLRSGWKVVADIPGTLTGGRYTVRVTMRLSTGRTFDLNNGAGVSPQDIFNSSPARERKGTVTFFLGLVLALALSVLTAAEFVAGYLTTRIARRISGKQIALLSIVFVFLSFVAAGTTGSSIGLGLTSSPFTNNEVVSLIGKDRPIRSDEWAVFTPFAIGQVNHEPPFPVLNENIGPDGQNMLVLGMTGVPVLHWSAIAKPATWGFFALDLPRALAWYWWFPPFSCLFALWLLLDHVFPGHWRAMLALSTAFTASPYVVAWSFWPAYSVMFPSVALLATLTICRAKSLVQIVLASGILGISLAGFVLLLYPAWQVPLGYLFLFVFLGLAIRDKLHSDLTQRRALAFASGLTIAVVLCWTWWMDARTAIQTMAATLYPGQRATVTGGDIAPWYWAKGLASVVTLYRDTLADTNQSEAASFIYLILPLAVTVVLRIWNTRRIDPLVIACGVFVLLVSLFQHVGIPRSVSQFSLWGRSTASRADIALGLDQIFVLGFVLGTEASQGRIGSVPLKLVALLGAVVWGLISLASLWQAPNPIWDLFTPSVIMVALVSVASVSYFLIVGARKAFLSMYVAWMLCLTLPFNPINLAPCSVMSNSRLLNTGTDGSDNGGSKRSGRILVIGSMFAANMLVASGRPTLNGVHYYPQHGLWQKLDPMGESRDAYNRYQHLVFLVDAIPDSKTFRIESQADVVRVVVDGTRFDFRRLGVGEVLTPARMEQQLDSNESIVKVRSSNGWAVYRVV